MNGHRAYLLMEKWLEDLPQEVLDVITLEQEDILYARYEQDILLGNYMEDRKC